MNLGPSIFLGDMTEPSYTQLAKMPWLHDLVMEEGFVEVNGLDEESEKSLAYFFKHNYGYICYEFPDFCGNFGDSPEKLDAMSPSVDFMLANKTRAHYFMAMNGGSSLKNLKHMSQLLLSGNFQKYDYAQTVNRMVYGMKEPE